MGEAGSRRAVDSFLLDRAAAADSVTNLYNDFPLCCPVIYQYFPINFDELRFSQFVKMSQDEKSLEEN